jgi:hypothetical protein
MFEQIASWLTADAFAQWKREQRAPLDRCYVELKPLGGAISRANSGDHASSLGDALWCALLSCSWSSLLDAETQLRIEAALRRRLDTLASLADQPTFAYVGYIDSDVPLDKFYDKQATKVSFTSRMTVFHLFMYFCKL